MSTERTASLDQFRGYTVAGMLLVNFLGGFAAVHPLLKHHNTYCSYADTIMPHFFFAVGFTFRLTFMRHAQKSPGRPVFWRVVRRLLGLLLVGFIVYHLDGRYRHWAELKALGLKGFFTSAFKRSFFQTLTHIAVASLWVVPVMARGTRTRILFATGSALLHIALSGWFNYDWVHTSPRGIDGGPLGFLTWTVPLIAGSVAHDIVARATASRAARRLAAWGLLIAVCGWVLSMPAGLYTVPAAERSPVTGEQRFADSPVIPPVGRALALPSLLLVEPPFVPPPPPEVRRWSYWSMSQRAGAISYQLFAAGLSLLVYALFVVLADRLRFEVGLFRALGRNALMAYVLDGLVADAIKPFAPGDAPLWWALLTFSVHLLIVWLFVRHLERNGWFLRV